MRAQPSSNQVSTPVGQSGLEQNVSLSGVRSTAHSTARGSGSSFSGGNLAQLEGRHLRRPSASSRAQLGELQVQDLV